MVAGCRNLTAIVTSPDQPIATHDIALRLGISWRVQLIVEGGNPDPADFQISVTEVEDDATRAAWLRGENVSFVKSPNWWYSTLAADGIGAFTQCGDTGKLVIQLGSEAIQGIAAEMIVEPLFDIKKVKSITPVAGTDKVAIMNEGGAKATIGKAQVSLQNGLPRLTFRTTRRAASPAEIQEFAGRVVDAAGSPVKGVRIGLVRESGNSGGDSGIFTKTDNDGQFAFKEPVPWQDEVEKQSLSLVITKDGYSGFDSRSIPLKEKVSPTINLGTFTLQPAQSLPVRVVDENDKPLAGAVIEPGGEYALRRQAIRTDEQGRGLLSNLPSGVVRVSASYGEAYRQMELVVSPVAAKNVEATIHLDPPAAPRAAAAEISKTEPLAVGQQAPEWSLAGWSDGRQRQLSDYRGKIVVLDFWATCCGGCLYAIPVMEQLAKKYEKQGIVCLGIHTPGGAWIRLGGCKMPRAGPPRAR